MHIHAKGEIIDTVDGNNDVQQTIKVRAAGGAGRYGVDVTVACTIEGLSVPAFQVPFKVFSFDLETSIANESVLCAAAWIEDMGTGTRQNFP